MDRKPSAIQNLPTEIIYLIFDKLPVRTLHYVVRLVCKRFAELLSRDGYFMVRFKRRQRQENCHYPLFPYYGIADDYFRTGKDLTWTDISVRFDIRDHVWRNPKRDISHFILGMPHHSTTVDTVCLMKNAKICASGGRDRVICLWDVEKLLDNPNNKSLLAVQGDAHRGWVWDLTCHDDESFFSCGWDLSIKRWSVERLAKLETFQIEGPCMCVSSRPGLLAAGLHSGTINVIDPRIGYGNNRIEQKIHKGAITGIRLHNNQVISIGEDRKMAAYDIRNQQTLFYRNVNVVYRTCPRRIAVYRDVCYIGDSNGYLNLFSMAENFKPILCAKVGEDKSITGIIPTLDGTVIGTLDAGIRFLSPTVPVLIEYDTCSHNITSIDYKNNIVAAGSSDSYRCIHIFKGNFTDMD